MAKRPTLALVIGVVLRGVITTVFVWAGVIKAIDPGAFQRDVASYQLLPTLATLAVATYLPWLEIVSAMALWIRALRQGGEWLLLSLTGVFLIAITSAWWRGLDLRCGCFGQDVGGSVGYGWLLLRDLGLLVAIVCEMRVQRGPEAKERLTGSSGAATE